MGVTLQKVCITGVSHLVGFELNNFSLAVNSQASFLILFVVRRIQSLSVIGVY